MIINDGKNTLTEERKVNAIHKILFKTIYRKKDGHWRAEYLKKHRVFHAMGDNCYLEPAYLPADACLISIGNNVRIAAVVAKRVFSGTIVGGNPARVIGYVDDFVEKRLNFKEPFWNSTREKLENFYF